MNGYYENEVIRNLRRRLHSFKEIVPVEIPRDEWEIAREWIRARVDVVLTDPETDRENFLFKGFPIVCGE